jgi:hypothetical protein
MRLAHLCAIAIALAAVPALAQPTANTEEALRRAYDADAAFAAKKWDQAYDGFAAAEAIAHSPVFVLFMGHCRRNQGRLREAYDLYAAVTGEKLAQDAPKPFRDAATDAKRELDALRARIPSLRVLVANAKDAALTIDGAPAEFGEPTLLDPGSHEVVATSAGQTVRQTVSLREGAAPKEITLSFAASVQPPVEEEEGSLVPGIVVITIGGAALALGAITGGIAASMASDLKERCVDGHCPVEDQSDLETAQALAIVSTVGFVVGGVGVVTGGVLLFVRPGGGAQSSATIGLHAAF